MINAGLTKYTGPWTKRLASHLLRRCTFGPSASMIDEVTDMGLEQSVDLLFNNAKLPPDAPVKWPFDKEEDATNGEFFLADPDVNYGETWTDKVLPIGSPIFQEIDNYRRLSVIGREFLIMQNEDISILSKMSIFWHNHFVVGEFIQAPVIYQYISSIHEEVIGNFKTLTEKMTIDIGMMLYLNGAENIKQSPNENYARELLELFTLGKGEQTGPGEYTNYTENDIIEISKILTGWGIIPNLEIVGKTSEDKFIRFYPGRHDNSNKTLSDRFGNATISNNGENEYKDLINIIFQQNEVAKFICRQFYRYFVNFEITEDVETNVIEPMAQILRDDNYEVEGALKALLSSEHFHSEDAIGCMIKNPADYIMTLLKSLKVPIQDTTYLQYFGALVFSNRFCAVLDMGLFDHPDVAGWKAYYQEPGYYKIWLNSSTLPDRTGIVGLMVEGGRGTFGGNPFNINPNDPPIKLIDLLIDIPEAPYAEDLVKYYTDFMLPNELSEEQMTYLLSLLLDGQAPTTYTDQFLQYLDQPTIDLRNSITKRLNNFIIGLFSLPEAQLM